MLATLQNTLLDAGGQPRRNVRVHIRLVQGPGFDSPSKSEFVSPISVRTNNDGLWSVLLKPNSEFIPSNTYYSVEEPDVLRPWSVIVAPVFEPQWLMSCLISVPPNGTQFFPGPQGSQGPQGNQGVLGQTGPPGPPLGLSQRTTATAVTSMLSPGVTDSTTTLLLAAGYRLYSIQTNRPARVRLYETAAQRDADLSRVVGVDPALGSGVVLDYLATDGSIYPLSPLVDGVNMEDVPNGYIPMSVTNLDIGASQVSVSVLWIQTEQ